MQTSRISTWFIMNYAKFAHFTKLPKCADQQNKFQNSLFNGNYFPKHFIFYRYMDTPSKVAHTKYAVAETCASNCRLVYANCCKLVFSSSYAGCFLPCLLVLLFLRVGSLRLFWGMVVRGCARRDLC